MSDRGDRHLLLALAWAVVKPDFRHVFSNAGWMKAHVTCSADVVVEQKLVLLDVELAGFSWNMMIISLVGLITCKWRLFSHSAKLSTTVCGVLWRKLMLMKNLFLAVGRVHHVVLLVESVA